MRRARAKNIAALERFDPDARVRYRHVVKAEQVFIEEAGKAFAEWVRHEWKVDDAPQAEDRA